MEPDDYGGQICHACRTPTMAIHIPWWDNEADAIRETDELNREADSNEEYYFFEEELRGNNARAE